MTSLSKVLQSKAELFMLLFARFLYVFPDLHASAEKI